MEVVTENQNDFHELTCNSPTKHASSPKHACSPRHASKGTLWKKYECLEEPDMFSFLSLARDGGFSEVKALYNHSRWFSAMMLLTFVLYNVESVIRLDVSFMLNPEGAVAALGGDKALIMDTFYLSEGITTWLSASIFGAHAKIQPVRVLGCLELLGLAMFFFLALHRCYDIACDAGFRRWFAVQDVFWNTLPTLSSYSAIKLLNNIVPAVMSERVSFFVALLSEAHAEKRSKVPALLQMTVWLFTVVFAFVIGFDTFLMKLRVVAAKATAPEMSISMALPCIQFLIQVLGVVQLGPFVRARLFKFIFGGEDGVLQEEEIELMDTWNALLARKIHRELSFSQFLAVMMSFSDEDFQSLVLNEDEEKKDELKQSCAV